MDFSEFSKRFRPNQEIGRAVTDAQLAIYCDNGSAVGVWRHDRATTQGRGEILSDEEAHLARSWFSRSKSESEHRRGTSHGAGFDMSR